MTKTQHIMCLTPLHANKQNHPNQDMSPPTNNWRQRRTEHVFIFQKHILHL